jgi:hypothetical protein
VDGRGNLPGADQGIVDRANAQVRKGVSSLRNLLKPANAPDAPVVAPKPAATAGSRRLQEIAGGQAGDPGQEGP